jgi:uracil-DNA glycosylase
VARAEAAAGLRTWGTGDALGGLELFGCFHVSQRNTFTGRLTPAMLREVLGRAAEAAGLPVVYDPVRP